MAHQRKPFERVIELRQIWEEFARSRLKCAKDE